MHRLLIANRGEIACRIAGAAHSLGIATVAVYAAADATALHVAAADEAVALVGRTPAETYLDVGALVAAAVRAGADAVHPGYGFVSESPAFARACGEAGLVFVGPPPDVLDLVGSKIRAKRAARAAGVPVLDSLEVDAASVAVDGDALTERAGRLGWPLLVKASGGGGGRGMRLVTEPADLAGAVQRASAEASAAFGDPNVFIEPALRDARHVEVQILADHHGTVLSLGERDCSVQRRYQKIVEEAPAPDLEPQLRSRLSAHAVALARHCGYVGAGTVEFLVGGDGRVAFLEVNPRLQVEHPVTEAVTGLDLVALQLRVAAGEALESAALAARAAQPTGHAVEARLYAEDPRAGHQPRSGRLALFDVPRAAAIRVDTGVRTGDEVTPLYDALLAKLVAHAPTRTLAVARLRHALRRVRVHGVATNRDQLIAVLEHPAFVEGAVDTTFLDRHDCRGAAPDPTVRCAHALAVAAALAAEASGIGRALPSAPRGWRSNPAVATELELRSDDGTRLHLAVHQGRGARSEVDGVVVAHDVHATVPDPTATADGTVWRVDQTVDGLRRRVQVHLAATVDDASPRAIWVDDARGATVFELAPRLPAPGSAEEHGGLTASLPGTVLRVHAAVGQRVVAGDPLVVIESMKMEHVVMADHDGVVSRVAVRVGEQVAHGALLCTVESADRGQEPQ